MPYCWIEEDLLELIQQMLIDCGYDESVCEIEIVDEDKVQKKCEEDCCKDKLDKFSVRKTPLEDW